MGKTMTRDEALERALQVLREIATGEVPASYVMCDAQDALHEIQQGLWIEQVNRGADSTRFVNLGTMQERIHYFNNADYQSPRYLGDEPSQHSEDWGDK